MRSMNENSLRNVAFEALNEVDPLGSKIDPITRKLLTDALVARASEYNYLDTRNPQDD